ncbi:family 43 glycosylhydrolase [Carnobacterium sp.]|uniref:glycoside hydrolase family 43 protein n=1 Tax=Carnobacterium sp. TaxID=48221 RepID=UPI00388FB810
MKETLTQYKNPIVLERADPWIYKHTDGYYYFTGSVPGYQEIEVRRARSLNELEDGEKAIVWHAHENGEMSKLIWAPEIHFIRGKWYIYFAAASDDATSEGTFQHRMYVLECADENPLTGEWIEKGQVKTETESFSLDATTFEYNDKLYYVWAQKDPSIPGNSNLYLSEMENPWTLVGNQLLLSIPEYDWEKIGFLVNEGPAVIIRNDKIFISYSASATDENYCMGLLWANVDDDLLNKNSWNKLETPVFISSEENLLFGPGHNSFTVSEDGNEDVLIYHARPKKVTEVEPLDVPDRHANAQVFTWNEEGMPIFGMPGT